jgi:hypothetical protein
MNQGGELNGYDLQVLRDYALEAPWEWRKTLERLIAAADEEAREEALEGQLVDWKTRALKAKEQITALLAKMPSVVTDAKQLTVDTAAIEHIEEVLAEIVEDLTEVPPPKK